MKHPYPLHVVDAVQKQMDWSGSTAQVALQALWDASRVDTLDQLAQLPGDAVILGRQDYWLGYTPEAQFQLDNDDLPAHVLHWGDEVA